MNSQRASACHILHSFILTKKGGIKLESETEISVWRGERFCKEKRKWRELDTGGEGEREGERERE